MADLNSLIPAGSGWVLTGANAINNRGQIVGSGVLNGQTQAFLLTPATTTTPLAQPAISTPMKSPAGDPSLALVLARPTSASTVFGPPTVSDAPPTAPSPERASPSPPPATWAGAMPDDGSSSPSPAGATDGAFAETHTDANDDGDWLTPALFLNDQWAR
jgi:probable HAF family extracellular repeat protein